MNLPRRRMSIFPVLIGGVAFALFFAYPKFLMKHCQFFIWPMFGLLIACFALVLGTMLYLKLAGRNPESIGVKMTYPGGFDEVALIGAGGQNAPLRLRKTSQGFIVKESLWTIIPTLLGTGLFGPFLLFAYLRSPNALASPPPLVFAIVGVAIVALSCLFFALTLFKSLFVRPHLEITRSSIRSFKHGKVVKNIDAGSISDIASRSFLYNVSNRVSVENFIVYAKLKNGGSVPLCTTDKQKQQKWLTEYFVRAGYPFNIST